jgi:2-amino-4-hydroxy-6-hydroxymethyldihydropteridine diphosphokinase
MPPGSPSFLNQVVKGEYRFLATELMSSLEQIERGMGRGHKGDKQPRTIDLDILLFGDAIIENERLSIPHRELLNRPFAMIPLLQIEPDIVHPVTKTPVAEFLSEEDRATVLLYKDHVPRHI